MALGFCKDTVLSTDKRYFFLENKAYETNGYDAPDAFYALFEEYSVSGFIYNLGEDKDPRYSLVTSTLLTFNTETETDV